MEQDTYFKYPEAVRRLIYTTNAIEGFDRQLQKVTKSKTVFPSDGSLLKMLYLATMDITKIRYSILLYSAVSVISNENSSIV